MPELPEVELTMRVLRPRIIGKRLVDFECNWLRGLKSPIKPAKIPREIEGLKVKDLRRHGKVLFINLDSPAGLSFAIHLGMSGALLFGGPKILAGRINRKHVRFIWQFVDGEELWFRDIRKFGVVWYGTREELAKDKYLSSLGPDALAISFEEFRKRIIRHRGQLKPLLLRQDVVAGLGNITADESLWEARLHPKTLTIKLSDKEIKTLYVCIQKVLRRIIKAEGNTMRDWVMPDGRRGRAVLNGKTYGREGEKCLRCGSKIKRIVLSGRSTHFCPKCQTYD